MNYVVNTPTLFGNTDKVYGISNWLSYPNMEEIQAMTELWTQFYGLCAGEFQHGGDSTTKVWPFWSTDFKPSRTFFDWNRLVQLGQYLTAGGYSFLFPRGNKAQGAIYLSENPLQYLSGQIQLDPFGNSWASADGSDVQINYLFNGTPYYYDTTVDQTLVGQVHPITDLFGTFYDSTLGSYWKINQFKLRDGIEEMWKNLQPVCNNDLYSLVYAYSMFGPGSLAPGSSFNPDGTISQGGDYTDGGNYSQALDKVYYDDQSRTPKHDGDTYQNWLKDEFYNSQNPADDVSRDFMNISGWRYDTWELYTIWERQAYDYYDQQGDHKYKYRWYRRKDHTVKTNNSSYFWKKIPIPSTAWGQNNNPSLCVPQTRNLLVVWKVKFDWTLERADGWHEPRQPQDTGYDIYHREYEYLANYPFTKRAQWNDQDTSWGQDFGNCIEWVIPWGHFDSESAGSFYSLVKGSDWENFPDPYDPGSGWGQDTGEHNWSTSTITNDSRQIRIYPWKFYSVQKSRLTQSVTYPQPQP